MPYLAPPRDDALAHLQVTGDIVKAQKILATQETILLGWLQNRGNDTVIDMQQEVVVGGRFFKRKAYARVRLKTR